MAIYIFIRWSAIYAATMIFQPSRFLSKYAVNFANNICFRHIYVNDTHLSLYRQIMLDKNVYRISFCPINQWDTVLDRETQRKRQHWHDIVHAFHHDNGTWKYRDCPVLSNLIKNDHLCKDWKWLYPRYTLYRSYDIVSIHVG